MHFAVWGLHPAGATPATRFPAPSPTRGLNRNHNRLLKLVFKGAATSVIQQHPDSTLRRDYDRLLAAGTKPNLAKVTLARKIAAITLALWKNKEKYDPHKTTKPSKLVSSSVSATVV